MTNKEITNKEAIEKLGYIKNQYHTLLNFDDYDEVFDKAINALRFIDILASSKKTDTRDDVI
jgi:hypothetical protein